MEFPLSKINEKDYKDKIYNLIIDDECHIIIDTNIIALFYRIHDSARTEFFDWLNLLIEKKRVKVPTWVIHEYSNRFIRNQIQDYLSPLNKVSTLNKEFDQISSFLKMHIDSSSLNPSIYSNVLEFQNDLADIKAKFKKIALIAKNKDEKYKIKIHDEISHVLGKSIINTNIDEILEKINSLGLIRFNHKMPPGFKDDDKDFNAHGDLILWYEILEYCRIENIKKVLLLTNDGKKDWVYAPSKLIVGSKEIPNSKPLKIADPRLVHEFKKVTDSNDFYIINFELFTQILIENISNIFTNLASALQLVYVETNEDDEKINEPICPNEEILLDEIISQDTEITKNTDDGLISVESESENVKQKDDNILTKKYSIDALADSDFPLIDFDDNYLTQIIVHLKSYNWYVQNPCIEELLRFDSKSLRETQSNSDKLFVIGRNIYQSAIGGSAAAVNFTISLRQYFDKFTDYFINHIYSGMLYEIYFDSNNKFRGDKLKSYRINEVLSLTDYKRLESSFEFLKKALTPYESELLFVPFKTQKVIFEPSFMEDLIEMENWLTGRTSYLQLISFLCNNKEILTEDDSKALNIYYPSLNLDTLILLICETYGIPFAFIEKKIKNNVDSDLNIILGNKKFASASHIINS